MAQKPTLRWLPDHLFSNEYANKTILLYYTGITRLAKNILHEIVRGIFLNSPEHLRIVEAIGANAITAFNAAQKADYPGLVESIHNSWNLNQRLDSGTNPPAVQAMLDSIADYIDAAKLLGAGGGGYLLLFAKDIDAARKIRTTLQQNPPNPRARMVNLSLSDTGLQLTRS
jgi:galactokinase/mevalonate kinase-like predicted kinase